MAGFMSLPCVFRGEYTGRTEKCHSCAGNVQEKVFKCSVHNECTIEKPSKSVILGRYMCCSYCKQRIAPVPYTFIEVAKPDYNPRMVFSIRANPEMRPEIDTEKGLRS